MIKAEDFCNKVNGAAWVNRAEGENNAYDCWGLVIASFREVDGVELPQLSGYADKKCDTPSAAREMAKKGVFKPSQATDGAIMVVMDNKGNMTHVGRCLCGRVLHATSGLGVRWDTYQSLNNEYRNIGYFKYANH